MSNICISAEGLSKKFSILDRKTMLLRVLLSLVKQESFNQTHWVLRDMSCIIKKGERMALLGRNGRGKTTFLRILTNIYHASSGKLQINGTPRIMFNTSIGLNANLSVLDNIYLLGAIHGIERKNLNNEIENILDDSGLDDFRHYMLKKLSSGQIQRLSLSVFFKSKGDLLIFDEALSFVDHEFIKTFNDHFSRLSQNETTVIITSHDSAFLKKHCTTAMWLEDGKVRMHGSFDEVNAAYEKSFKNSAIS